MQKKIKNSNSLILFSWVQQETGEQGRRGTCETVGRGETTKEGHWRSTQTHPQS